jgi:alkyl hydroperoxide reductase subunit AhpC
LDEFRQRNAEVFGVSMDSRHTNAAYAASMGGLDYPLLSDWLPHGGLTRALGIEVAEAGCPSRTTVIVDPDGTIVDVHTNPMGEDRDFAQVIAKLERFGRRAA